ncbi:MAG: aminotransferase class III-fold pyridoxal phosphate-dependent enzyme [Gammaproteobacteria bacterium]|nr:aminotransferase class III-fold pyridoxal phosphate-dependent enzyme [Gammaproteobacteria bacterium]
MPHTEIRLFDRNLPNVDVEEAANLARTHFAVDGDLHALGGERDQNFRLDAGDSSYVFKISNAEDGEDVVGFQVEALQHVKARDRSLPVPELHADRSGRYMPRVTTESGDSHILRLVSYLPGVPVDEAPATLRTWREIGALMGRLNLALGSFYHPAARANDHPWDTANCLRFQPLTEHIADKSERALVNSVFDRFREHTKPRLDATRHQIIHQDAHCGNVLVDANDPERITGLIDFGDMLHGPVVADLAIIPDRTERSDDNLLDVICHAAIGFDATFPLQETEVDLLFDVICARYALGATIVAARNALHVDGPRHMESSEPFITPLDQLVSIGSATCTRAVRRACRFPAMLSGADEEALLDKRRQYLGKNATHFYARPMHFERASGPFLYSTDGNRYLDCYNNVPQVGHCNPHVVKAIARQAAALNTNTRYLYSSILEYAERLTDKLAPHLDACVFVNSGSEANDIAWQMARIMTGRSGGLLMEDAYHGITGPIREFSPGHPDTKLPDHLQGLIVPDPYRGKYRDDTPDIASRYAADADRAIADLARAGHETAAFMIDSALCSSGVPETPDGYLREVEKRVHAVGGLMICDEVQSGFGRMGQWWGHELHGLTADFVTMGKPVGNGHPLGVIVTRSEILERFTEKTGLFSTFGGNTVACAAGNAVLDVIERDELIENGRVVGEYFREQLRELSKTHALIGNVRGNGMLTGLEFVSDRDTRTPATEETARLLELMRQRHVLVGNEGRDGNILKLRPSLVFTHEHVDLFIDALDGTLGDLKAD